MINRRQWRLIVGYLHLSLTALSPSPFPLPSKFNHGGFGHLTRFKNSLLIPLASPKMLRTLFEGIVLKRSSTVPSFDAPSHHMDLFLSWLNMTDPNCHSDKTFTYILDTFCRVPYLVLLYSPPSIHLHYSSLLLSVLVYKRLHSSQVCLPSIWFCLVTWVGSDFNVPDTQHIFSQEVIDLVDCQ